MTVGGWIFMLGSLATVYTVATWCYIRVLGSHGGRDEGDKP